MKQRLILTVLWLISFALALGIIEGYVHTRTGANLRILLPDDRGDCMQPLIVLYSLYISGILGFWFYQRWKSPRTDVAEKIRFWLALSVTAAFNILILYFLSQHFFGRHDSTVLDNVETAVKTAKWLSFIVAPVNAYYFGMKGRES